MTPESRGNRVGGKLVPTEQKGSVEREKSTRGPGRTTRVVNSALWAGWADAVGFISELTSESGLQRRLKGLPLEGPVAWKRRVGGRGGPDVQLPPGTYSDDTQLRLATGRCLSNRGFDVEAFAHIELPNWLAYALGGGTGTKAAAARMMKPAAVWYAGQSEGWIRGGGNGAAMRIQPHVWASDVVANRGPWLSSLMADAATTHAHPRALLGAAFHAYALSIVVSSGQLPDPAVWVDLLGAAAGDALDEMHVHPEIGDYWIGAYDKASHREGSPGFVETWWMTADEMRTQLKGIADFARLDPNDPSWYATVVAELGLADPATRGSGSGTTIAALALAWAYRTSPRSAALRAASEINTDTDTIATMAAALAGAVEGTVGPPVIDSPEDYSDQAYIASEAQRLAGLALGEEEPPPLRYPDVLTWALPKAQVDLIGESGGDLWLAGMTKLVPTSAEASSRGSFVWQWFRTDWNQHILAKVRAEPKRLPADLLPAYAKRVASREEAARARQREVDERSRVSSSEVPERQDREYPSQVQPPVARTVNTEFVLEWLGRHDYTTEAIGYAVKQMAATATAVEYEKFTRALRARFQR